jgi:hypothetical protein
VHEAGGAGLRPALLISETRTKGPRICCGAAIRQVRRLCWAKREFCSRSRPLSAALSSLYIFGTDGKWREKPVEVETGALACRPTRRGGPLRSATFESLELSRQCWAASRANRVMEPAFQEERRPPGGGQARAPVATLDGLRPSKTRTLFSFHAARIGCTFVTGYQGCSPWLVKLVKAGRSPAPLAPGNPWIRSHPCHAPLLVLLVAFVHGPWEVRYHVC